MTSLKEIAQTVQDEKIQESLLLAADHLETMKTALVRIRWDSNLSNIGLAKIIANDCLNTCGFAPPSEAEIFDIHALGQKERLLQYNFASRAEKAEALLKQFSQKEYFVLKYKDSDKYAGIDENKSDIFPTTLKEAYWFQHKEYAFQLCELFGVVEVKKLVFGVTDV